MADQSPTPSCTSSYEAGYLTYNLAFKYYPYKYDKTSDENRDSSEDDREDSDEDEWIPTAGYGASEDNPLILSKPGKYMIRLEFGAVSHPKSDASWHVKGQVEGRDYSGYFTGLFYGQPTWQDTYVECAEISFYSRKAQEFKRSSKEHIILGKTGELSPGSYVFSVLLDVGVSLEPLDRKLVTEYLRESQRKLYFYVKVGEEVPRTFLPSQ